MESSSKLLPLEGDQLLQLRSLEQGKLICISQLHKNGVLLINKCLFSINNLNILTYLSKSVDHVLNFEDSTGVLLFVVVHCFELLFMENFSVLGSYVEY